MARQSEYADDVAASICERLAVGESLRTICDDPDMPAQSTVFKWLADQPGFVEQYAHARATQADALFDEILTIADDGRNDWIERQGLDGSTAWKENGEAIRRSQLRIDARKWMAAKLAPKKYGDKLAVDHAGEIATTVRPDLSGLTAEERRAMRRLLEKARPKP